MHYPWLGYVTFYKPIVSNGEVKSGAEREGRLEAGTELPFVVRDVCVLSFQGDDR
ncbi:MAG: hypothetical protein FWD90_11235 [Defluviitaleaceae bacterium]|nr:hypothetical protein [Defluviitaleaceae bacterium]